MPAIVGMMMLVTSARADLILIDQTRTVQANGTYDDNAEPPPECDEWYSDETVVFGLFEATVNACGGSATQISMLAPSEISALGSAHGWVFDGGGFHGFGHGESIFEVVFESPNAQGITITGQIHTEGNFAPCAAAAVTLFDEDGTVLFEESLAHPEGGTIEFNQELLILPSVEYTLRAIACSLSCSNAPIAPGGCSGNGGYEIELGPDCPADIIGNDGMVDVADLLILLYYWGEPDDPDYDCDLNDDGLADVEDLLLLLAMWGPCP
jgi:hypothetical protein